MKIRAKIAKGEAVRFISHLDFAGTLEKAVRRAKLPMALSGGFTPRLKINFASALALGFTSEAEYADFELQDRISVAKFIRRLNQQLPKGIEILEARQVADNSPALMAQVAAASYRVVGSVLVPDETLVSSWDEFLEQDNIIITKTTKRRQKQIDIRPWILKTRLYPGGERSSWDLLVTSGQKGNLRPEELLQAFFAFAGLDGEIKHIHRTGLYIERFGHLVSPLARLRVPEEVRESE